MPFLFVLKQVPVLLPFLLVLLFFLLISRPCNLLFFSVSGFVFEMLNLLYFFLLPFVFYKIFFSWRQACQSGSQMDWKDFSVSKTWWLRLNMPFSGFLEFCLSLHIINWYTWAIFMKMRKFLLEFSVWILQPRKETRQLIFVHPMWQNTIFLWFTTSFVQWRDQDVDNWSLPFYLFCRIIEPQLWCSLILLTLQETCHISQSRCQSPKLPHQMQCRAVLLFIHTNTHLFLGPLTQQ